MTDRRRHQYSERAGLRSAGLSEIERGSTFGLRMCRLHQLAAKKGLEVDWVQSFQDRETSNSSGDQGTETAISLSRCVQSSDSQLYKCQPLCTQIVVWYSTSALRGCSV